MSTILKKYCWAYLKRWMIIQQKNETIPRNIHKIHPQIVKFLSKYTRVAMLFEIESTLSSPPGAERHKLFLGVVCANWKRSFEEVEYSERLRCGCECAADRVDYYFIRYLVWYMLGKWVLCFFFGFSWFSSLKTQKKYFKKTILIKLVVRKANFEH